MALSFAKAAPLKPEIKLAQALSEFEAVLSDDQKSDLRTHRAQSPPTPADVMRFTAKIDRDASRNRKSRQCVGTRLTNVLNAVQQFSTVADLIVGNSQSQIAGAIWGTVKICLQLASAVSSYFDQLSILFMRIGVTCPRLQDLGHMYPESKRLKSTLCKYFIVVVRLCKQSVLFLKKPFWSQLSSSILKPFESEFGGFQQDLEILASAIRDEVTLSSNQAQQNEAKEMSRFRVFAKNTSTRDIGEARIWKRKRAELQFLDACSVYKHERSWKQARKRGNTSWICHDEGYKQWKQEKLSSTLWCTGMLGSGKTVLSANVVEDLKTSTPAVVAYFFCRHDEAKSLETRTIIGSIARQIFDHIKSDIVDKIPEMRPDAIDTDQVLEYLEELPSISHKYFIIIDGLDECQEKEIRLLLQCLKQLLVSKNVFRVYCSSRPDVFRWAHTFLEPQWNVSMSQTSTDIEEYVEDTLMRHLESRSLSVGDPTIILTIQDALLQNAHGMFLWVVFQIDSICSQKTDEAILTALGDLPKDLPDTFNRILRKLQYSNTADPQFCRKIFDFVAAAQRPLTLGELREAVSVKPGETSWDASKLVNDMLRSLLDSCGSLIAVDEEDLTVSFAHQSVKQHLLSEPTDLATRKYHFNMREADLHLGDIIVTYLNFEIFDRQVARASPMLSQTKNYPSAILGASLPRSNIANRLAMRLLKKRGNCRLDIPSQLKAAAGTVSGFKEQTESPHPFLPYAQEYWLFHTKSFKPAGVAGYSLWQRLIDDKVRTIELPWAPHYWGDLEKEFIGWIIQKDHWALMDRTLVKIAETEPGLEASNLKRIMREVLEKMATDVSLHNIDLGAFLCAASVLNIKSLVQLSLEKGADTNAEYGYYGTVLHAASLRGFEGVARLLLENGANVNAEGGEYSTALQAASASRSEQIVRLLLENGANVNAEGGERGTALYIASATGYEEIVRLLLENGANVNAEGGERGTALYIASAACYEEIVRLLLENGANVNAEGGEYGTALQTASARGSEGIARLLLENGANVNAEGGRYGTALRAASARDYKEIVRLLLANGANVNAGGGRYGTALQTALANGSEEIVRLLLKNGANVNAEDGRYGTVLQAASANGSEEIVRLLLENGANVNTEGGAYGTALQAASANGSEEIARLLLENGANVNAEGGEYGTALQAATERRDENIVRLLLENGANVNAEGGEYGTALQAATERRDENIVRLLLENGANANAEGRKHGTALQAASASRSEEIVRLLLENGANVNTEGGVYGTALQAASARGFEGIARLLLENGANVNIDDGKYGTALQAASACGSEQIVRFLLENGANVNAEGGQYGTALQAASAICSEKIVRLLLKNGAIVNSATMELAQDRGYREIEKLLRNAWKRRAT